VFTKSYFSIICSVLSLLLILALVLLEQTAADNTPKILGNYLLSEDGSKRAVSFPFIEKSSVDFAIYEWIVDLEWHEGDTTRFYVNFTRRVKKQFLEAITVNGQIVPEDMYPGTEKGRSAKEYVFDLAPYLADGFNEIQLLTIAEDSYMVCMDFAIKRELGDSFRQTTVLVVCILLVLALVFLVLHRFKIDKILIGLILLALTWQLISLAVRDYRSYAHDLDGNGTGHIGYIHYIADNGALPPPHGWSYYHPPLYYITAAGVFSAAKAFGITDLYKPLQILSLVLWWVFIAYSMRLLAQFIKNPWIYRVAAALLLFWPAGALAAIRITNDALLYPLFMIALFYGHRWFIGDKWRDLLFASIACGIGFFAKISIFPLACVLGGLVLWRLYQKRAAFPLRHAFAAIAILVGSFFLSSLDNWIYEFKEGHPKWYIASFSNLTVSEGGMGKDLFIKNRAADFIVPDIKAWFEAAYIVPWEGSPYSLGRGNIWNYTLKTSLYGEWGKYLRPDPFWEKYAAPFLNTVFAFLFVLACYGLFRLWRGRFLCHQSDFRFIAAVSAVLLLFLVTSRINQPTPTIHEFRYILPLMPVMVIAVAAGLTRLQGRRWLFISGTTLIACFIFASFAFYLGI